MYVYIYIGYYIYIITWVFSYVLCYFCEGGKII